MKKLYIVVYIKSVLCVHCPACTSFNSTYCPVLHAAGIVLTGRNGLIPVNSFFTENSSVLTPFEGTVGKYIRCGSIGGSPDWYRENGGLFGTSNISNNYYYKSSNSAEFWTSTLRLAINKEVECRPVSSLNLPSGWIGLFFRDPTGE